jgi:hypothetical protein
MPAEPMAAALLVIRALERLGVPYLIGGSLASTVHGAVRTTQPGCRSRFQPEVPMYYSVSRERDLPLSLAPCREARGVRVLRCGHAVQRREDHP